MNAPSYGACAASSLARRPRLSACGPSSGAAVRRTRRRASQPQVPLGSDRLTPAAAPGSGPHVLLHPSTPGPDAGNGLYDSLASPPHGRFAQSCENLACSCELADRAGSCRRPLARRGPPHEVVSSAGRRDGARSNPTGSEDQASTFDGYRQTGPRQADLDSSSATLAAARRLRRDQEMTVKRQRFSAWCRCGHPRGCRARVRPRDSDRRRGAGAQGRANA